VLEVVEHEQRRRPVARSPGTSGQVERRGIHHPERFGDRGGHERGSCCGQPHEDHAGCAVCRVVVRELQRKTRLAGSSRASERDETNSGIREPLPQRLHFSLAAEKGRHRQGQRDVTLWTDVGCGCSGAPNERVTDLAGHIERRRQRSNRLDMRPSPFAALQRAHAIDRQARDRRELLLSKACGFAERLELGAKRTRSARGHDSTRARLLETLSMSCINESIEALRPAA
jgi:hypothetical protein